MVKLDNLNRTEISQQQAINYVQPYMSIRRADIGKYKGYEFKDDSIESKLALIRINNEMSKRLYEQRSLSEIDLERRMIQNNYELQLEAQRRHVAKLSSGMLSGLYPRQSWLEHNGNDIFGNFFQRRW